jgi:hypothetical protein
MLAGIGYACEGDMNCDNQYNVLDIVHLSVCVLHDACQEYVGTCGNCNLADMNGDGGYNVLDIVQLANCVLSDSCGGW